LGLKPLLPRCASPSRGGEAHRFASLDPGHLARTQGTGPAGMSRLGRIGVAVGLLAVITSSGPMARAAVQPVARPAVGNWLIAYGADLEPLADPDTYGGAFPSPERTRIMTMPGTDERRGPSRAALEIDTGPGPSPIRRSRWRRSTPRRLTECGDCGPAGIWRL